MDGSQRRYRVCGWLYFLFGISAISLLARSMGASTDLGSKSGLWLSSGLVMLLAAFVLEPRFSGAQAAIANSFATIVGVLASGFSPNRGWWCLLLGLSILSFGSLAIAGVYVREPASAHGPPPRWTRVLRVVGQRLGSWKVLLLGLFTLTLTSFSTPQSTEWNLGAGLAVYAILLSTLRPDELINRRPNGSADRFELLLGPPAEAVIIGNPEAITKPGDQIVLAIKGHRIDAVAVGKVIARDVASWWLYVPQLWQFASTWPRTGETTVVTVSERQAANPVQVPPNEGKAVNPLELIGLSAEGATSGELVLNLAADKGVLMGDLLCTRRDGKDVLWQVADANTSHQSWPTERYRTVQCNAFQLGVWDNSRARFSRDLMSPPSAELVYRFASANQHPTPHASSPTQLGSVMGSTFPVLVDPISLGRQHAAVIGVTGTGKTHLTFGMIEALISVGTTVICVDMTGQYRDRFSSATAMKYEDAKTVLKKATSNGGNAGEIIIVDPGRSSTNPVKQAEKLVSAVYDHVKPLPRLKASDPARFVIVLEEAHNFIPEAFVINDWELKAEAQKISKVFMESRKFGLGFVIVTQRTAMVTKSALSQCGSLFVFQSVDQTGIDFIEGFCGRSQSKALPLLGDRTALAIGRAISSDSPLFMTVAESQSAVS